MARTNRDGRELQPALGYILNRQIPLTEIQEALGVVRNTAVKRSSAKDFPNAQECLLIGRHFKINPVRLMLDFGIITPTEVDETRSLDTLGPIFSTRNAVKNHS